MSNILVVGLHKTGTTGLYHAVKTALDPLDDYAYLFEPKSPEPLLSLTRYAPERPILTKILVNQLGNCAVRYQDFEHRFMTVRDPRDMVISRLLFRPMFGDTAYRLPVEQLDPFVSALRQKVADPASRSVLSLHRLADELGMAGGNWSGLIRQMDRQREVLAQHAFSVVTYEEFVRGELQAVSERLGVEVTNPAAASTGGWLDHIQRSMGYGEWRHWFLREDIEHFRDLFGDYAETFGYEDWQLAADPSIDPATSCDYVERKVRDHLEAVQERSSGWSLTAVRTEADLVQLRGMAEDGRAVWAYRLATVHQQGAPALRDRTEAVRWAREAAVRGHAPAMKLLADLLEAEPGHVAGEVRFWRCEHDRLTGTQPEGVPSDSVLDSEELAGNVASMTRRLRKTETELARAKRDLRATRSSTRYKLGSRLVGAVPHPLRGAFRRARRKLSSPGGARPRPRPVSRGND